MGCIWSVILAARFGGLGLKTIGGGFGPENLDGGSKAEGWHVVASESSCRGEATNEKVLWLSDEVYPVSDHNALGFMV